MVPGERKILILRRSEEYSPLRPYPTSRAPALWNVEDVRPVASWNELVELRRTASR